MRLKAGGGGETGDCWAGPQCRTPPAKQFTAINSDFYLDSRAKSTARRLCGRQPRLTDIAGSAGAAQYPANRNHQAISHTTDQTINIDKILIKPRWRRWTGAAAALLRDTGGSPLSRPRHHRHKPSNGVLLRVLFAWQADHPAAAAAPRPTLAHRPTAFIVRQRISFTTTPVFLQPLKLERK